MKLERVERVLALSLIISACVTFIAICASPDVNIFIYDKTYALNSIVNNDNASSTFQIADVDNADGSSILAKSTKVSDPYNYASSFSFDNGSLGDLEVENGYDDPTFISIDDEHASVIDLENTSIYYDDFSDFSPIGIVEFWIKCRDEGQYGTFLSFLKNTDVVFFLTMDWDGGENTTYVKFSTGSVLFPIHDVQLDIWCHFRIIIDTISKMVSFNIDGSRINVNGTGYFVFSGVVPTTMKFTDSYLRLDALGISWDGIYHVGSNVTPMKQHSLDIDFDFKDDDGLFESVLGFIIHIKMVNLPPTMGVDNSTFIRCLDGFHMVSKVANNVRVEGDTRVYEIFDRKTLIRRGGVTINIIFNGDLPVEFNIDLMKIVVRVGV